MLVCARQFWPRHGGEVVPIDSVAPSALGHPVKQVMVHAENEETGSTYHADEDEAPGVAMGEIDA
jgi:hypothetical protein